MRKINSKKTYGGVLRGLMNYTLWYLLSLRPCINLFIRKLNSTVSVLMYHGIAADDDEIHSWTLVKKADFENQIIFLKKYFDIIPIGELDKDDINEKDNGKPKLIITFDDGLKNQLTKALPLLKKYNVPATIYISTDAVQKSKMFWWDNIIESILEQKIEKIDLYKYGLKSYNFNHHHSSERIWIEIKKLLEDMKNFQPNDRQKIIDWLTENVFDNTITTNSPFKVLTPMEVLTISKSNLITIGSHTHCHNILTQIPYESVEETIKKSKDLLKKWTGKHTMHFSYPNGNYNNMIVEIVRKQDFETAVTTENGRWKNGNDAFTINRVGIGGYDTLQFFKCKVSGSRDFIKKLYVTCSKFFHHS